MLDSEKELQETIDKQKEVSFDEEQRRILGNFFKIFSAHQSILVHCIHIKDIINAYFRRERREITNESGRTERGINSEG